MNPSWYDWAIKELGQHEEPENRGPIIRRYIKLSHCGAEGDPWCAIFANAALEANKINGTKSPSSQSFRHRPDLFTKLDGPALGALAIYWRISPNSGFGHVGFYDSETVGYVNTLGGNEQDAVRKELLAKNGGHSGLIGYWWPRWEPLPKIGPIKYKGQLTTGAGKVT